MRNLIMAVLFFLSAGLGTLASAVLRKRLGSRLQEMDREENGAPEEKDPEGRNE